jgi:hypothetical protein
MTTLAEIASPFIEMAHRIVWCAAATVDTAGRPRGRILHPIWEWDGASLTGWIATSPLSLKATHLAKTPSISLTYWTSNHDTATAECDAVFDASDEARAALWDRLENGPAPVGYDPAIIPGWDSPQSEGFGALVLDPWFLRVMPGSVLLAGTGEVLTWKR